MVKPETKIPQTQMIKKKYKGVRMRSWGSWVSEIRAPNQKTRLWLGSYSTPVTAARAYDATHLCLRGYSSTSLNFPTSMDRKFISSLPQKQSMSPKAIQSVAAAAATPAAEESPSSSDGTGSSAPIRLQSEEKGIGDPEEFPWFSFDSPNYYDMMVNGSFLDYHTMEDSIEDGDNRLWSFC